MWPTIVALGASIDARRQIPGTDHLIHVTIYFLEGRVQGKSFAARRIGYPADEDAAIFATLAKPKTLDRKEDSLGEILDGICGEAGIPLWIDTQALSDEGISLDEKAVEHRRMQGLPLGICLKKILPSQLTYVVDEGVLMVTTQTAAAEMLSVRFYDVRNGNSLKFPTSG